MKAKRVLPSALALALLLLVLLERHTIVVLEIGMSDFELERGVYFDPTVDRAARYAVLALLSSARQRVGELYGPLQSRPTLIVAQARSIDRFGANATAITRYLPWGAAIVLGPKGQDLDVLAHELAHAELHARIGHWRMHCIPTWFDEGLALHFDNRAFYGEQALAGYGASGVAIPPLAELASERAFFAGALTQVRSHYALARLAVDHWLATRGRSGALRFIATFTCGSAGEEHLHQIEALQR